MNTDEIRAEWSGDEREIATVVGDLCDDVDRRTAQVRKLREAIKGMLLAGSEENWDGAVLVARAALDETEES